MGEPQAEETGQDLWNAILRDVTQHTGGPRHLDKKTLLVLGDEGSGKSKLISRLQGRKFSPEDHPQGTGLEYTYIDVKDADGEEVVSRMDVYMLDGNLDHSDLLLHALTAETLPHTLGMLVADMSRPWLILNSLQKWANVLEDRIKSLDSEQLVEDCKNKLIVEYQRFAAAGVGAPSGEKEKAAKEGEEEDVLLPLEEGVFTVNVGIPLIVVLTKVDTASTLEKERDFKMEHFDFIQFYLRKFALKHGAACVYSGKEGKNKDSLYGYLLHRAYGFPYTVEARDSEIETLFIPSGWDSDTKINVLKDGLKSLDPEEPYDEQIAAPIAHDALAMEREVMAEDEQEFLKKQQPLLGKSAAKEGEAGTTARRASLSRASSSSASGGAAATKSPRTPSVSKGTGKEGAAKPGAKGDKGGAGNADVLANFFNSLLNKKTTPGAATGAAKGDARADAKEALTTMQKK